jgi:hypothetical protein
MNKNNSTLYRDYFTAKKLEELGYNKPTLFCYVGDPLFNDKAVLCSIINAVGKKVLCSCPTIYEVIEWIRDKYDIEAYAIRQFCKPNDSVYNDMKLYTPVICYKVPETNDVKVIYLSYFGSIENYGYYDIEKELFPSVDFLCKSSGEALKVCIDYILKNLINDNKDAK